MNEKKWDLLAKDYHKFVISPFQEKVKNPLFSEIKNIRLKKNKTVADFGCGRFELAEFLAKNFKKVKAYDFSEKMIEIAKEKEKISNVDVEKQDMTQANFNQDFDIVISVNSILMPELDKIKKSLNNIYKSLKQNGAFFLIVPSMESIIYEGMLILEQQLKEKEEKKAILSAKIIQENKKYDYFLATYTDRKETQKFYYKHEIEFLLEKTGFKNINIKKVEYPWTKGISDHKIFPGEKPLWDWFISCKK